MIARRAASALAAILSSSVLACTSSPDDPLIKLGDTSTSGAIPKADLGEASASDPDDTGAANDCDNPAYTCAGPTTCNYEPDCGPLRPFRDDGCPRRACEIDADCNDDDRCYRPSRFGLCDELTMNACEDEPGGCVCTISGDDPAYCVAASDYPQEPETPCSLTCGSPGNHSSAMDGNCYCDRGFQWCVPDDPMDFTCCEP